MTNAEIRDYLATAGPAGLADIRKRCGISQRTIAHTRRSPRRIPRFALPRTLKD